MIQPHARHTYLLVPTPPSLTFLLLFFGNALSPVSDADWNVVQACAGNRSCCEFLGAGAITPPDSMSWHLFPSFGSLLLSTTSAVPKSLGE